MRRETAANSRAAAARLRSTEFATSSLGMPKVPMEPDDDVGPRRKRALDIDPAHPVDWVWVQTGGDHCGIKSADIQ